MRLAAASVLGRFCDKRAIEPLISALLGEDLETTHEAAMALSVIGEPSLLPLVAALDSQHTLPGYVLREALGKTPDGDYIDYYAQVKRDEFRAWHSGVSDWEVERYLTLF